MSKVKIQGNASGTGIFTIAAPATNTDRTITLPDVDATVLTTAGGVISGVTQISNPTETGYASNLAETVSKATLKIKTHYSDSTLTTFGGISGGDAYIQRSNGPGTGSYNIRLNPYGGAVLTPSQPRFHAAQRTSNSSGIILSFQLAHVNVGGHFNGTRFTCPIAGKYKFYWASLFGGISTVGRFWLFKNGTYAYGENSGDGVQLRIDNSDGHGYPYGERTIMVSANAGDYFEIYYACDNGGTNGGAAGYNTFGGELLG